MSAENPQPLPKQCSVSERSVERPSTTSRNTSVSTVSTFFGKPTNGNAEEGQKQLLEKTYPRLYRNARFILLTSYQRIFTLAFILNVAFLIYMLAHGGSAADQLSNISTAVSANLTVAILSRQEHIVNVLFRSSTTIISNGTPLWLRKTLVNVFHYGGLHTGCASSAVVWFILFSCKATKVFTDGNVFKAKEAVWILAICYLLLSVLITMVVLALPPCRQKLHNAFEAVHRFGGWTSMVLFWTLTVVATDALRDEATSLGHAIIRRPSFWLLMLASCTIIYPWTRLRRVPVQAVKLSSHASLLIFTHRKVGCCVGLRISDSPLMEYHAFATIPGANQNEFAMLVSHAGDWTRRQIDAEPTQIWMRDIPACGMLYTAQLFRRIVLVATGSGLGPCLSLLKSCPDIPVRIIWSARSPTQTYGRDIVNYVYQADRKAVVLDTKATGRPNMIQLAYNEWEEFQAEAVFIISNPKTTGKTVYGLRSRGVLAYGPIFDS